MGIGVSVFLLALGAILAFAVEVETQGFDLNTVGVILMIVGAVGLLAALFVFDRMGLASNGRRTVVREDAYDIDGVPRTVRERSVVEHDVR